MSEFFADSTLIMEKYYKGWSIKKIADVFEISEDRVYMLINTIKKTWRERNLESWNYYVNEELEKLKLLEKEIWIALEESKADIVQTTESVSINGEDSFINNSKKVTTSKANYKYTEQLLNIHKARAELLRLYPSKTSSHEMEAIIVSDEQAKTLASIMEKRLSPAKISQATVPLEAVAEDIEDTVDEHERTN